MTAAAPAPPAPVRREAPADERTSRTLCDGSRCWVTVALHGNEQIASDAIFGVMKILDDKAFDPDMLDRDVLAVTSLYWDRGFADASVTPPVVDRSRPHEVRVDVTIDEGARYELSSIEVRERILDHRCPLMDTWSTELRPGDMYDRSRISAEIGRIQRLYRDRGYAKVDAVPRTTSDRERGQMKLSITVSRGAIHAFGSVSFEGNRVAKAAELRPYVEVVEGARFSEAALDRTKARLLDTGLFERVDFAVVDGKAPATSDVVVIVVEREGASTAALRPPAASTARDRPKKPTTAARPEEAPDLRGCERIPSITARHVLVMYKGSGQTVIPVERSREEALQRARDALRRIRDGARFTDVVDAYSDEPNAHERGGELGEFDDEVMVEPFSKAAFRLHVGEVSDIVETVYGLHIIQRTK